MWPQQSIKDKYERGGNVVDAEIRSAFPSPPPLAELNAEQTSIVETYRVMEMTKLSRAK